MESKPVRTPAGVKFPIIKGELVTFIVQDGKVAQTNVLKICRCRYSKADKKVYITVETGGSIYQDAPVSVRELPNCSKDQVIEVGQAILDSKGNPVIIAEILQISEVDGVMNVIFKNSNDETFATPFILA